MKTVPLFLCCCFFCLGGFAQTPDTSFISFDTEKGVLSKQQIADQYDYVFGTKVPARWMFKANPFLTEDIRFGANFTAENKISPAFSVLLGYGLGLQYINDSIYSFLHSEALDTFGKVVVSNQISIQTRWYFDMPRHIREGKSASNFSGNYVGLELAHTAYGAGLKDINPLLVSDNSTIALRFGVQRRMFETGYFDISFGMGARHSTGEHSDFINNKPLNRWDFFASTQVAAGYMLSRPKLKLEQELSQCDILQCFREENRMWKIDLFSLVRIRDKRNARAALSFAFEQKIAQSPFSVEAEVHGSANSNRNKINYDRYANSGWNAGAYVQSRYYYRMIKQIAAGKSGNNLSGPYFALQITYDYSAANSEIRSGPFSNQFDGTEQNLWGGPFWGVQYRIFNRVFVDLNFGLGFGSVFIDGIRNGEPTRGWARSSVFASGLRVGLAL